MDRANQRLGVVSRWHGEMFWSSKALMAKLISSGLEAGTQVEVVCTGTADEQRRLVRDLGRLVVTVCETSDGGTLCSLKLDSNW